MSKYNPYDNPNAYANPYDESGYKPDTDITPRAPKVDYSQMSDAELMAEYRKQKGLPPDEGIGVSDYAMKTAGKGFMRGLGAYPLRTAQGLARVAEDIVGAQPGVSSRLDNLAADYEDYWKPQVTPGSVKDYVGQTAEMVGGAIPVMAASRIHPLLGAAVAGVQAGLAKYGATRQQEYTPGTAAESAAVSGALNAAMMGLPLGKIAHSGAPLWKKLGIGALTGGALGGVQAPTEMYLQGKILDQSHTNEDYGAAAKNAAITGALGMPIMEGGMHLAQLSTGMPRVAASPAGEGEPVILPVAGAAQRQHGEPKQIGYEPLPGEPKQIEYEGPMLGEGWVEGTGEVRPDYPVVPSQSFQMGASGQDFVMRQPGQISRPELSYTPSLQIEHQLKLGYTPDPGAIDESKFYSMPNGRMLSGAQLKSGLMQRQSEREIQQRRGETPEDRWANMEGKIMPAQDITPEAMPKGESGEPTQYDSHEELATAQAEMVKAEKKAIKFKGDKPQADLKAAQAKVVEAKAKVASVTRTPLEGVNIADIGKPAVSPSPKPTDFGLTPPEATQRVEKAIEPELFGAPKEVTGKKQAIPKELPEESMFTAKADAAQRAKEADIAAKTQTLPGIKSGGRWDYQTYPVDEATRPVLEYMRDKLDVSEFTRPRDIRDSKEGYMHEDLISGGEAAYKPTWTLSRSTYPEWSKTKADLPIIDAALRGETLTVSQRKTLDTILKGGKSDYAKQPRDISEDLINDRIVEGDKVTMLDSTGKPDVYEHKGWDEDGKVILKDGETRVLDPYGGKIQALKVEKAAPSAIEPLGNSEQLPPDESNPASEAKAADNQTQIALNREAINASEKAIEKQVQEMISQPDINKGKGEPSFKTTKGEPTPESRFTPETETAVDKANASTLNSDVGVFNAAKNDPMASKLLIDRASEFSGKPVTNVNDAATILGRNTAVNIIRSEITRQRGDSPLGPDAGLTQAHFNKIKDSLQPLFDKMLGKTEITPRTAAAIKAGLLAEEQLRVQGKTVLGTHKTVITDGEVVHTIQLATDYMDSPKKAMEVLLHEGGHGVEELVRNNVLKPNDIKILDAKYKGDKEAIADGFAGHAIDRLNTKELSVRLIFDKVKAFFERVGNMLKGLGFRNATDVFGDAMAGKLKEQGVGGETSFRTVQQTAKEVADKLKENPTIKRVGEWVKSVQRVVSPAALSEQSGKIAMTLRENLSRRAQDTDIAVEHTKAIKAAFDQMTPEALTQMKILAEKGQLSSTPDANVRKAFEYMQSDLKRMAKQAEKYADRPIDVIENYWPHLWEDPKRAAEVFANIIAKRPFPGSQAFTKGRTYDYIQEGLDSGLKLKFSNPVDEYIFKKTEISKFIMANDTVQKYIDLKLARKLTSASTRQLTKAEAAHFEGGDTPLPKGYELRDDGTIHVTTPAERPPEGWAKITDRIRGGLWMPEDMAQVINNYLSPGLRGNALYDDYMKVGNAMNQASLGISFFHGAFVGLDASISDAALGLREITKGNIAGGLKSISESLVPGVSAFKSYQAGKKVYKQWIDGMPDGEMKNTVEALVAGGGRVHMDSVYATNMYESFKKSWREASTTMDRAGAAMKFPGAVLDLAAKPLMEKIVPNLKLGVFSKMAQAEMARRPNMTHEEMQTAMTKIWDSVDNRMGQMVYDNLFMNKTLKDVLHGTFRSVGWNIGDIREVGGGAYDTLVQGGRLATGQKAEFTHRMAYMIALPTIVGLYGAMTQYMLTGKGPDELKDYYYPKTGSVDADGHEERLILPSYMKDIVHVSKAPGQVLKNKLHPLLNNMAETFSNKDYYGTEVYHPDDPMYKKGLDVVKHFAAAFEPFSIRGIRQMATTGGGITGTSLLPSVGLAPAPKDTTRTDAENILAQYAMDRIPAKARTQEAADKGKLEYNILRLMKTDPTAARAEIQKALTDKTIKRSDVTKLKRQAKEGWLVTHFKKLDYSQATKIYNIMTDAEKTQVEAIMKRKEMRERRNM